MHNRDNDEQRIASGELSASFLKVVVNIVQFKLCSNERSMHSPLLALLLRPSMGASIVTSMSVCLRAYLRNYTSDLTKFLLHVTYDCGSVLRQRCDTLRTNVFTHYVTLAHRNGGRRKRHHSECRNWPKWASPNWDIFPVLFFKQFLNSSSYVRDSRSEDTSLSH